ncbi:MAG: lasso peptide [Rhizonema sp. PD37]|nr:lasso peptide [Rhizonema sp. PD37]
MKSSYTVPKLTVHGNVADITHVLGDTQRTDFTFLNGRPISGGNDIGSTDICSPRSSAPNTTPSGSRTNCDSRFP